MKRHLYRAGAAVILFAVLAVTLLLPVAIAAQGRRAILAYVFEKVSPCLDSRQEWFTVATNYPGEVGSAARWDKTEFPGGSFLAAAAEADKRKLGKGFEDRCCRDWVILRHMESGKLSVQKSPPGTPVPYGFDVQETGLCCEEAMNRARIPVATEDCRRVRLSNGQYTYVGLPAPTESAPGGQCFVWERVSLCMDNRQEWFTVARSYPGEVGSANRWERRGDAMSCPAAFALADKLKMDPSGFFQDNRCCREWGVYRDITTGAKSVVNHIKGSPPQNSQIVQLNMCCESAFNLAGFPPGNDCRLLKLSDGSYVTHTAAGPWVPFSVATPLPPIPPPPTFPGSTTTPPPPPPPTPPTPPPPVPPTPPSTPPPCTSEERAMWARITGSWKASYGPVTFTGTCENVSGSWQQGDYADSGAPLKYTGIIKNGRATARGVWFEFAQDWNTKKGSDSCTLEGTTLDCRYMGRLERR